MYEIGVMTALADYLGPDWTLRDADLFVGTSAGSIIAAVLANDVHPAELMEAILYDRNHPFNFKREDIFGFGLPEAISVLDTLRAGAASLIKDIARHHWRITFDHIIRIIDESLGSGLFTTERLEDFIRRALTSFGVSDRFQDLPKKLLISATNLDTGRYVLFGEGEWSDVPISKAVAASCAIPIFYQPVRIKGVDFVDGGTAKVSYTKNAAGYGANVIIVVNPLIPVDNNAQQICIPTSKGNCGRISQLGMSRMVGQVMRINNQVKLKLGLQRFQMMNPDVDLVLIQPRPRETDIFLTNVMSFRSRRHMVHMGYCSTRALLDADPANYKQLFQRIIGAPPAKDFSRADQIHSLDADSARFCRLLSQLPVEKGFLLEETDFYGVRRRQLSLGRISDESVFSAGDVFRVQTAAPEKRTTPGA